MTEKILSPDSYVFETIVIEDLDHVLSITLNRPEKKNAINDVMSNEIIYALNFAKQSDQIRVVKIQANGDVFCAGGDLKNMGRRTMRRPQRFQKLAMLKTSAS